jgi:hypothetical protein
MVKLTTPPGGRFGADTGVWRLSLLYVVSLGLWALLVALYPLAGNLALNRRIWGALVGGNLIAFAAHATLYAGLFCIFLIGLREAHVMPARTIWLAFFATSALLLLSFPGESLDIFDYLFRGRMMVEYGASPLYKTPYDFRTTPFHRYVTWSQWVDAYGPMWEYVSAAISWLVKQTATDAQRAVTINNPCLDQPAVCSLLARYVTGYRLAAIALTAACGALIAQLAPADERSRALHLFLMNPLTLLAGPVGGHNEALMLVFVLAWVLCFSRGRFALGMLSLAAAAHVKFTALLLAPIALLWLVGARGWRTALRAVAPAVLLAAVASWLAYRPLGGWETLPKNLQQRAALNTNSLGELLNLTLFYGLSWEKQTARDLVARAASIAFALPAVPLMLRWLRQPLGDAHASLRRAIGLVLLYLLIGSYWFQPWYALWPLALVALLPRASWHGRELAVLALTLSGPAGALFGDFARAQPESVRLAPWLISIIAIALIHAPAYATILYHRMRLSTQNQSQEK